LRIFVGLGRDDRRAGRQRLGNKNENPGKALRGVVLGALWGDIMLSVKAQSRPAF
jgi:hypothetical protein